MSKDQRLRSTLLKSLATLSILSVTANAEPTKPESISITDLFLSQNTLEQALQDGIVRNYHLDTDEWLSSAKMLVGNETRIGDLQLDLNTDIMMVTGFDCEECRAKVYDSKTSSSMTKGVNQKTEFIYQSSKFSKPSTFHGYFVMDQLCFNGGNVRNNCTSRQRPGYEFFVINSLKDAPQQKDRLFAGVMGLSVDPHSDTGAVIEYLKANNLVDNMTIAISLDNQKGKVVFGRYEQEQIQADSKELLWVGMNFTAAPGGWLDGWTFNATNVSIGGFMLNNNDTGKSKPIRVLPISKNDHGYTLVTNHHATGGYFIGNITEKFGKTLGASCERKDTPDTKDGHNYACFFAGQPCDAVGKAMGTQLHITLSPSNDTLHLKLADVLLQDGADCRLNVGVHHDPSVWEEFLAVGLATFARSQYLVFDYTYDHERVAFGGPMTLANPKPKPDDHKHHSGVPAWAVILMLVVAAAIIGVIVYLYMQMRKKKIESDLEEYETLQSKSQAQHPPQAQQEKPDYDWQENQRLSQTRND